MFAANGCRYWATGRPDNAALSTSTKVRRGSNTSTTLNSARRVSGLAMSESNENLQSGGFSRQLSNTGDGTGTLSRLKTQHVEAQVKETGMYRPWGQVLQTIVEKGCPDGVEKADFLVSLIDPVLRDNAAELNMIVLMKKPIVDNRQTLPVGPKLTKIIGNLITSVVMNYAKVTPLCILIHLQTGQGKKSNVDQESWALADIISRKIEARQHGLPTLIMAITSMQIRDLVRQPVEVSETVWRAINSDAFVHLSTFLHTRAAEYLHTVLQTVYGFSGTEKDVPACARNFVDDVAGGSPRFIEAVIADLIAQGAIELKKPEIPVPINPFKKGASASMLLATTLFRRGQPRLTVAYCTQALASAAICTRSGSGYYLLRVYEGWFQVLAG